MANNVEYTDEAGRIWGGRDEAGLSDVQAEGGREMLDVMVVTQVKLWKDWWERGRREIAVAMIGGGSGRGVWGTWICGGDVSCVYLTSLYTLHLISLQLVRQWVFAVEMVYLNIEK